MKRLPVVAIVFTIVLTAGFVLVGQSEADTTQSASQVVAASTQAATPTDLLAGKRCSTSSDCPNSKCKSGKCGGCSTSSDCTYGKCSSGWCGSCSTSSDCKGWGKCKSGKCGGCSTSSDCGSFGSCSSGHCSSAPY